MSIGVASAYPNISLTLGGATLKVCANVSGLTLPVIGTTAGPAMSPVIVPIPSMSSLYSDTTQLPPTTGVAAPVSFQVSRTSNSSSTSSSEVFSLFSVGSSTYLAVQDAGDGEVGHRCLE